MTNGKTFFSLIIGGLILSSCVGNKDQSKKEVNGKDFKAMVEKTLMENPEILIKVIESHPERFTTAFQQALEVSQGKLEEKWEQEEKEKQKKYFETPLMPKISDKDLQKGLKEAPLVLVKYLDFECGFCANATQTVDSLLQRFPRELRVVFKHLPLDFHPHAKIAAQYFEAIGKEDKDKAFAFYYLIFEDPSKLRAGENYLEKLAKKVGANMEQLKKRIHSPEILQKIKEDMEEAKQFGIEGTPGFLLNGVPIYGAYPEDYFLNMIEELKKRNLVKL